MNNGSTRRLRSQMIFTGASGQFLKFLLILLPKISSSFAERAPKLRSKNSEQVNNIIRAQNNVQTVAIAVQCQNILSDL